jgi:hypothetical protein
VQSADENVAFFDPGELDGSKSADTGPLSPERNRLCHVVTSLV